MENNYYYKLYYGSTLLRDSSDLGDYYETEDEAREAGEDDKDYRIKMWQLEDAWHEWDSEEDFDIVIEEV